MAAPGQSQQGFGQRYIDPEILTRIDNLELVARGVVDGFISGMHRSARLGMSVDFAEHRAYMPSDDIRRIDWRVFARTDRLYVKQFEADTNANLQLLLDVSRSMDFGSGAVSKLEYAKYLAASLAYLSTRQRDRIGMVSFDNDIVEFIPGSVRHFRRVLLSLEQMRPGGVSEFQRPLQIIAERLRRRSLVVLISDLYETPAKLLAAIKQLHYRGNDLIVFHLLDPLELSLNLGEAASVTDLESGVEMPITSLQFGDRYRQLVSEHQAELERRCGADRIDYIFCDISQPLDETLSRYLSRRMRQIRIR